MITEQYFYNWYCPGKLKQMAGLMFLVSFLFLFLFRPFTVTETELKYSYLFTCFLHALSPALIMFSYFTILIYFQKTNPDRDEGPVFKWITSIAGMLFLIGLASFFLRDLIYTNPNNWSLRYLWEEIRNAYLAGTLFFSYFLFARSYFHQRKTELAAAVPVSEITLPENQENIFVKAHVKIDDFNFNPADFLFARAEGNYVEITMRREHGLQKELRRISLKQLELQLTGYVGFLRCHRAYLINIQKVADFSGNSQGYLLSFDEVAEEVPVSRANLQLFDQRYQMLHSAN
ncbi:LytTR family DNA-binding domain-containing protein [Pedobacter sp. FW305-3-2-15-E-R2A2]|uniref:LytR/AlgR family response regulator transcription factor n=1 Tax=Pedobacter sp. FW305-3-2-15-E-R2A2 TaxID=3140251 RepID=UPI003140A2FE